MAPPVGPTSAPGNESLTRTTVMDQHQAEVLLQSMADSAKAADPQYDGLLVLHRLAATVLHRTEQGDEDKPPEEDSALWNATRRYRALVEQIPVVTFMAGLDESVHELYISPQIEALLGFTQREWLENPFLWYNQLHPDDRERWQEEFGRTCTTGVRFRSEYRFLARDGRVVWVHGECQLIRDDVGRSLFLQGIAYDITESKLAQEQLQRLRDDLERMVRQRTMELEQSNEALRAEIEQRMKLEEELEERARQLADEGRRKDHFLAVLAHELRNPLSPISMAVQMLREPSTAAADRQWAQEIMERQLRHMVRLIDDLLDISRISRGKVELHKELLDLTLVVARAVETTRSLVNERGHKLTVSSPGRPIWVEGDTLRLEQVVVNLLTNAAKYTEPGGQIAVCSATEDKQAVVRVRDNGHGIPPEMLDSIFEMFTQVDATLARKSQWGLGIGLALVRGFVELHGGDVKAFSAGPGQGSEFVVHLPLSTRPPENQPSEPEGGTLPQTRHKVLVVEDQPDAAKLLVRLLRIWGHEVRMAADGPTAIAMAKEDPPGVMLVDIGLPGMDGYDVAREIRRLPELQNTVLFALTGYAREEDREMAADAGFNHHLAKPVDLKVLRTALASLGSPPTAGTAP